MSEQTTPAGFDRRTFFRVGGTTIALSAVVAACAGTEEGAGPEGIAAAGERPPLATVPTTPVDDVVLLRTATSLHYNAMDVVDTVSAVDGVDSAVVELAAAYRTLLQGQADALAEATTEAGGQAYEQSNPVVDDRVIQPAAALLAASPTQGTDAANLLHAVAVLAAATHQAFVAQFADKALRQAAMAIGAVHSQVAASLAHLISPENFVTEAAIASAEPAGVEQAPETTVDAGLPTTVAPSVETTAAAVGVPDVAVYMVPTAFGPLSPTQVVLGDPTADGDTKRQQLNIETPSLNSMMY